MTITTSTSATPQQHSYPDLGAFLLGTAPAQHHTDAPAAPAANTPSPPHAPAPWLRALVHGCMDTASRLALHSTCTAGRDLVLRLAEHLSVRLHMEGTTERMVAVTKALTEALEVRSHRSATHLSVEIHKNSDEFPRLVPVIAQLACSQPPATSLQLGLPANGRHTQDQRASIMHAFAIALPRLTRLDVSDFSTVLPPPPALSHVTRLAVDPDDAASIIPYFPQLQELQLGAPGCDKDMVMQWATEVLSQHTTILSRLELHVDLTDKLLSLLLQNTPALQQLAVDRLHLTSPKHQHSTWGVTQLEIMSDFVAVRCELQQLSWLPQPSPNVGQTRLVHASCHNVKVEVGATGVNTEHLARLSSWVLDTGVSMRLRPAPGLQATGQHTALAAAMQQLQPTLQGHVEPKLYLAGFNWIFQAVLHRVNTALAAWAQHIVCIEVPELTDSVVTQLLDHAPNLRQVWATRTVALRSNFSNRHCQWVQVQVECITARKLACLPTRADGLPMAIAAEYVIIDQVDPQTVDNLKAVIRRFTLTSRWYRSEVVLFGGSPAVLRAAMDITSVMMTAGDCWRVALRYWKLEPAVIDCLQHLPLWGAELLFEECTYSNEQGVYTELARVVPASYKRWSLGLSKDCDQLIGEDVLNGVALHRSTGSGMLRLEFPQEWREDLRQCVQGLGLLG